MLSEGKARPAPPPHRPRGWRSRSRDKPQNLVYNLMVIPPPLDINFLHALGGFFSSLRYHPLFPFSCSVPLSLSLHFLGLEEQISLVSGKKFYVVAQILPLSNNRVAFLNITRWNGARHGNADFPQLVVISSVRADLFLPLLLEKPGAPTLSLELKHCPASCTTRLANAKLEQLHRSHQSWGVCN